MSNGDLFKKRSTKKIKDIKEDPEAKAIAEDILSKGRPKLKTTKLFEKEEKEDMTVTSVNFTTEVLSFYTELAALTGVSRSQIIDSILHVAIEENGDIQILASENPDVRKLVAEYLSK